MTFRKHWAIIVMGLLVAGMAGWALYVKLDTGTMPEGWSPMKVKTISYGYVNKNNESVTADRALYEWLGKNELKLWKDDRHPQEMEIISISSFAARANTTEIPRLLVVYREKNTAGSSWEPAGWSPED